MPQVLSKRWMKPGGLMLIFILLLSSFPATPAYAFSCTWSAASAGNWSSPSNWTGCGGGIPGPNDNVYFNATSVANATVNLGVVIRVLDVDTTYTGQIRLGTQTLSTSSGFTIDTPTSFNAGTGTVRFITNSQTVNSAAALYNVQVSNFGVLSLAQNLVINNNLTLSTLTGLASSGGSWQIRVFGDVVSNDASFGSTNTVVSLVGNTNQRLLGTGELVNLNVAKSGGNVVLDADFVLDNGTLTGSGLIQNNGGVLVIGDGDSTYTINFTGSIDDVRTNTVGNLVLQNNLVVNNTLNLANIGSINGIGGTRQMQVSGDITINDTAFTQANSILAMISGSTQNLVANVSTTFSNLTVGVGTLVIETVTADNLNIASVTNNGTIRKTKDMATFGTGVNVTFGLTRVTLNANALGTLTNVQVDRVDSSHPNATLGIQTGRYWSITPTGGGFNLNMTLPHSTVPTAGDKVCRYTGVDDDWECAADSFNVSNSTITRNNITQLSDWATGDNVGPTAITLHSMRQSVSQPVALFVVVALLIGFTGTVFVTRRRV